MGVALISHGDDLLAQTFLPTADDQSLAVVLQLAGTHCDSTGAGFQSLKAKRSEVACTSPKPDLAKFTLAFDDA